MSTLGNNITFIGLGLVVILAAFVYDIQKQTNSQQIHEEAPKHQGRTLRLRSEVEEWKKAREQG